MANHFSIIALRNPLHSRKRQKDRTLKDELVGAQYAMGTRKNERDRYKEKQHPIVDVTGDRNKVQCCKEQYGIGTWNP